MDRKETARADAYTFFSGFLKVSGNCTVVKYKSRLAMIRWLRYSREKKKNIYVDIHVEVRALENRE